MRNLVIASFLIAAHFPILPAMAETLEYPAEGEYVMGEGETMEVAGEKARKNAIRAAAEQAGSFVRSYSKVNNMTLQEDVIEVTANHAMKIVVLDEQTELVGKKSVRFKTRIKAAISSEAVAENLRKVREDQGVVEAYRKLRDDYAKLARETEQLKSRLGDAAGEERSSVVARIVSEEIRFKANLLYEKGERLFREEYRLGEAETLLSEAIRLNPKLAAAYAARGELRRLNDSGAALADLEQAIGIDPRNAKFYMQKADILRTGRGEDQCSREFRAACPKVLSAIDAAIALDPENSWYRLKKAEVLTEIQDHDAAMLEVDKAIKIGGATAKTPGEVIAALSTKAGFLSQKGELPQALAVMDKAVMLVEAPGFFTGEDRKIIETALSALEKDQSDNEFREALLQKFGVASGNDIEEKRLRERIQKSTLRLMYIAHVFDQRAKLRLLTRDYAGGKSDTRKLCEWTKIGGTMMELYPVCTVDKFAEALDRYFSPAGFWYARGQLVEQEYFDGREGRKARVETFDEAIEAYGKAVVLNPSFVEAYLARANLRMRLPFSEEGWRHAILDCTEAVRINPGHTDAWMNLGRLHDELDEKDKALDDYGKVIELGKSIRSSEARSARIAILRVKGNMKEALEEARQFAGSEPYRGEAVLLLAGLSEQAGSPDEALRALQAYLRHLEELNRNHQGGDDQEINQIRERIDQLRNRTDSKP